MHAFQISKENSIQWIGWVTRELLSALHQQGKKKRVQKSAARGGGKGTINHRRQTGGADRGVPVLRTADAAARQLGVGMGALVIDRACPRLRPARPADGGRQRRRAVPCGGAPTARATRLSLSAPTTNKSAFF